MMDGTLDAHLDLAANSVASHWFADRQNVIRIAPPSEYLPVSHTFADFKATGVLEYIDADPTTDHVTW